MKNNIFIIILIVFSWLRVFNANAQTKLNLLNIKDSCLAKYDSATNRMIYQIVDEMPSYRGGMDTILAIIGRNLKWPNTECEFQGRIDIGFIIETDGRLTNKNILNESSKKDLCGSSSAALNVLNFLTDWIPGKCHGIKVPVRYYLPIKFTLN
jgi:hypothetical protein